MNTEVRRTEGRFHVPHAWLWTVYICCCDQVKFNLIQYVVPELNNLYQWLEVEFHPLKLSARIAPSIEYIEQNEDLAQYVPALEGIIITRVLKQVTSISLRSSGNHHELHSVITPRFGV